MAQTKTSRSSNGRSKTARSRSNSKARSSPKARSSSRARTGSKPRTSSKPAARRNGAVPAAKEAIGKAKVPLVAGGTALAGLAAGAAIQGRRSGGKLSTVKVLGGAAKEIGKAGYRMGELTSEIRKVREQIK